jgi:AcrR family transcriptional regulator
MDRPFVERLNKAFNNAKMSDVARRLNIPHATVRNYYKTGRLPAPEVLIKIASETGVSLNWLLMGSGGMYAGDAAKVGLGEFLEQRIAAMIDERLAGAAEKADIHSDFDVEGALARFDEPERVISEWFRHEGRAYPQDFGLAFFRGWETFSHEEKLAAVKDAKKLLDRAF